MATFSPLSKVNEFNFEQKRGVGRDHIASASISVGVVRWASEDSFLTHLELSDLVYRELNSLCNTTNCQSQDQDGNQTIHHNSPKY